MNRYHSVPQELKALPIWCLWRYEQKSGKAKPDKVPYNPLTGRRARSNDPSTFADFETAVALVDKYGGIGAGIFGDLVFIDIDNCVEDGEPNALAKGIIRDMNSPAEISPSGSGVRILCRANGFDYDKARYYINNRKLGLEIYIGGKTNRFVTITGNSIHSAEFGERGEQLRSVLEQYMLRPSAIKALPETECASFLTDASVIEKAMHSEVFSRLWNGDMSGFASPSEADMSMASTLAFYCGCDIEQMDRVFRLSGLMRDKWERPQSGTTYGRWTLEKAAATVTNTYKPDFGRTDAIDDFAEKFPFDELKPESNARYEWNDVGIGNLFADMHKNILRYVPERKSWFMFGGKRWKQDTGGLAAMEKAKHLISQLMVYALNIKDERRREIYVAYVAKLFDRRRRDTMLRDAQSVYPASMMLFDNNKYLFNCENGTYDLAADTFREHRADDFLTKMSGVSYDPDAKCPRWIRFMREVMSGDAEQERFTQKAYGYALSGDTSEECLFALYGSSTRNGKGTTTETFLMLMGDYGAAVRPETIGSKTGNNSSAPSEDIARLVGVRYANISEPDKKLTVNSALVKTMTGNDTLNARFLHENSFDFKPQFKLFINCNHLPTVTDMTLFSSDRVRIIPFERHFEEYEREPGLKALFVKPGNLSAIFNWCVEGYRLYKAEGLAMPDSVLRATAEYQRSSDKVAMFVEERMNAGVDSEVRSSEVYAEYRGWCSECGYYSESARNFNASLSAILTIERKRPRDGGGMTTMVIGASLISPFEQE